MCSFSIKKMLSSIFYAILLNLCSVAICEDFCDPESNDNLMDASFNFNQDIYVFRKPNSVWLLRRDESSVWTQVGQQILLTELFQGSDLNSFDSAFSITDFSKCDPELVKSDSCDRESKDFDASNVTFVFDGNQFKIYRRVNERKFRAVTNEDTNIPWNANRNKTPNIKDLFRIEDRIDGAIFINLANDKFEREVIFYSVDKVIVFQINDKAMAKSLRNIGISNSPASLKKGNGGLLLDSQLLFIVDNRFYRYSVGEKHFDDTEMYSWRFFDCDNIKVIPETNSNETNESITTTEIHISRYITTPEIIEANTEKLETHLYDHIFLIRHSNQAGIIAPESEESPNDNSFNSNIDESNGIEELTNSQSLNMETIETTTEATPSETTASEMTSITLKLSSDYDEDDNYLETLKIITILLFVCITITAILVTSFAIIAFSIFRPQNSHKLETDKLNDSDKSDLTADK